MDVCGFIDRAQTDMRMISRSRRKFRTAAMGVAIAAAARAIGEILRGRHGAGCGGDTANAEGVWRAAEILRFSCPGAIIRQAAR